jgi:K+-sensing histidine kinase KdpD
MFKPRPFLRSDPSASSRYVIAVLSVAIGVVVAALLTAFLHTEPIASSMISAVMFAAWFGGFGPGFLASALAVLAIHYWVPRTITA